MNPCPGVREELNSYSGQTGCRNVQDDGEETSYLTRTDVCSLFVTYNPDLGEFHEALLRATDGSRYIVIVDNTTNPATQVAIESLIKDVSKRLQQCGAHIDFHLLTLGENRGLSTAYNNGIAKVRDCLEHQSAPFPAFIKQQHCAKGT